MLINYINHPSLNTVEADFYIQKTQGGKNA